MYATVPVLSFSSGIYDGMVEAMIQKNGFLERSPSPTCDKIKNGHHVPGYWKQCTLARIVGVYWVYAANTHG